MKTETIEVTKFNPTSVQANAPSSWGQVKYWATTAAKGAMVSAAAMVMAGFNLLDLHKKQTVKPGNKTGKNQHAEELPHDVVIPPAWPDLVKQYAGVSDETARRWMTTAEGVKSRWKKQAPQERLRELMRMPVSDWSEADTALVFKSLAKAIDGATMVEFMRELGLAKKPQGAGATGRLPECDGSKKKLSLSEEAALRKTQAIADWQANWKQITSYGEKFVFLSDDLVTAQCATLEQALKARREWLKQPATMRDAKAIAEMVKVNPEDAKPFDSALELLAAEDPSLPVVVMNTAQKLPDGNLVTVTGFAHDRRAKDGKEPFVVVFNDNTDKRRERSFVDKTDAEKQLGLRIKFHATQP